MKAASTASDLEPRFRVTQLLPILLLAGVVTALVASGSPADAPSLARLMAHLDAAKVQASALLFGGSVLLALVLRPFQVQLVRLLEGYWGAGRTARALSRFLLASELQRREVLLRQHAVADKESQAQTWNKLRWYPEPTRMLPTRLGNTLRSIEDSAGQRYGFETVVVWSRLYPLLGDVLREQVHQARDDYDTAVRLTAGLGLISLGSAAMLLPAGGWWRLLPPVLGALSIVSYRGACAGARYYGTVVFAAFDLHRFDLLRRLRVEMPSSPLDEMRVNQAISKFLSERSPKTVFPFNYERPDGNSVNSGT